MKRTAFFSAYNKGGLPEFGRFLQKLGWELWASGGTHTVLTKAGLRVADINKPTSEGGGGAPQMLEHRVATLHPNVHAPILTRGTDADRREMLKEGCPIMQIDLVMVNLYPFKETYDKAVAEGRKDTAAVIEKIDVGGMSLLHSPTKGRRIVMHSVEQIEDVTDALKRGTAFKTVNLSRWAAEAHGAMIRYLYGIRQFELEMANGQWDSID